MARPSDPNARFELLVAAEELFVARGLDETKVEQITERAGRSKGSFYLHFTSKEDAFTHVVTNILARLSTLLDDQARRDRESPAALEGLFEEWMRSTVDTFEFVWTNRAVMRLVLRGGLSSRFSHLIDEFAARVQRHTMEALQRGVDRGALRRDIDVRIASLALAGAYDRVARELVDSDSKPDLRALVEAISSITLGGIASDDVRHHATRGKRVDR